MAQTPPPSPAATASTNLEGMGIKTGGASAGSKAGPLVTEQGIASGPDAGILRSFLGSPHGHALVNGVFQGTNIANMLNPTAAQTLGGFNFSKKISLLGFRHA